MVEFRRIQMTLFVLLLQFTAVTGQTLLFIARAGDEVTLPSDHLMKNQDECDGATWLFSRYSGATVEELVNLGRINNNVISRDKSNRLRLTANCSLVIRNVKVEDVGRYVYRQFNKSGKQGPDVQVHLSVLNMEEPTHTDTVFLFCSVLTYSGCEHKVEWLYEGQKNDVETSHDACSASVRFKPPHLNQKSKYYELLKCNVTDKKSGNTLLSDVCSQFSCEKTDQNKAANREWWVWLIIVSVGLAALLILTVAVIKWKKTKGNRGQKDESIGLSSNHAATHPVPETSQDVADSEEGVSYASVSYTKKTNSEAQVRVKDYDDAYEAVTYSTVNAPPSSSAGASADLSNLYASVNKPNK